MRNHNLENEVRLIFSGCHGFCEQGPIMVIKPEGIAYCKVNAEDIPEIVSEI